MAYRMTIVSTFAAIFFAFVPASVPATIPQALCRQLQTIDRAINSFKLQHHVPGMSIAIVNDGKIFYARGYGLSDDENGVRAIAGTVYRIASLSKPITATAVMKLVNEKRLDLDAPIQKYCPEFPEKPWPITTRELLTHQSGIRDYRNDAETINTKHYSSIKEALSQFANDSLDFEPGTKMQYTSYGYIVLGCVIEGASGMSYEHYMQQAIFKPAHMSETRLDDVFAIIPNRARGYQLDSNGNLENATFVDVSNKPPGSGINSNANDMGSFIEALYSGKLLPNKVFEEMLTPAITRGGKTTIYGLGFFLGGPIGNYHGLKEAGHGGEQQGVTSVLYLLPEKKFGVVLLANLEGLKGSDLIALSRKIYDVVSAPSINQH